MTVFANGATWLLIANVAVDARGGGKRKRMPALPTVTLCASSTAPLGA